MTLNDVTISYGNKKVYENFSITFKDLSITAILGASGCGKTTLLNEIASRNSLHQISFIFQEPRLIPWETIEKNIMFALKRQDTLDSVLFGAGRFA
ncbi:ATP-binding cassette domain-containing protein [Treponema zuelzerae]|uniref:ATP-binding cassette domain-containing protein n=1 Tax=Teretinema zuelzerae TaxID=156 RepID=A0AAE3EI17_9SPIR|nr:ATP-binding cassette domain-containing protein [Teretinema zuelzerae]MCD1654600.1 ATP-binding cassette domain-containing protein [Teretinema zuelzerae]